MKIPLEAFCDTNAGKPFRYVAGLLLLIVYIFAGLFAVVNSVWVLVMIKLIDLC